MRILITAGPTWEPIDPVRYLGNRSSGRMGRSLAEAATAAGHAVTLIVGPGVVPMPADVRRIDIETTAQLHAATAAEFADHDLLIMAAAVADYRPKQFRTTKAERGEGLTIELEPTADILADLGSRKRADQRTVGFSLVDPADLPRSVAKLHRKRADLIVSNPLGTVGDAGVSAVLLYPDGRAEQIAYRTKAAFADLLIGRAAALFG